MTNDNAPSARPGAASVDHILTGYEAASADFINRTAKLPDGWPQAFLRDQTYGCAARVLDVGAGPARDTRRLAQWGHAVTAAEPVPSLRRAGKRRCGTLPVRWVDAALPTLRTGAWSPPLSGYRVIVANGIWHHVPPEARATALHRLCQLLAPKGRLIVSLRNGPTAAGRPGFAVNRLAMRCMARQHGLALRAAYERPSLQAANQRLGVSWTWLVLEKLNPPGRSSRRSHPLRRAGR